MRGQIIAPVFIVYSRDKRQPQTNGETMSNPQKILLTTETVVDFKIKKRVDVITAECVFGANIFRDIFARVRDIVGGRSRATQNILHDAREIALTELREKAHALGANAVVGIDLDYSGYGSMLFVVASGTAVIANLPATQSGRANKPKP